MTADSSQDTALVGSFKNHFELDYFDGLNARAIPCQIWLEQHGRAQRLILKTTSHTGTQTDAILAVPPPMHFDAKDVIWPEPVQGTNNRQIQLPNGASLATQNGAALDAWLKAQGLRQSWVVRLQQHWQGAIASVALLVGFVAAGYVWGIPLAASAVLRAVPIELDAKIAESAMAFYDEQWLKPSGLTEAKQNSVRANFAQTMRSYQTPNMPPYKLIFRSWGGGPNAFALPGGTMVMTDELVNMFKTDDELINGVLAHEYGHVLHRHGMHNVVRVGLLSAASAVLFGDVNSLLSTAPLLLGQMHYSRAFEHQADTVAADILIAAKQSPMGLARFFETMSKKSAEDNRDRNDDSDNIGIAISSHPSDAARIAYFAKRAKELE